MNLELRGVRKVHHGRGGAVTALENIDLRVGSGEFVCLVGPSGCGKTTLLNLLAGLESPSEGEVYADDKIVCGPDPSRVLIFQEAALFPWLTVQANVEFGLKMNGASPQTAECQAERLLRIAHLDQFSRAWVHELSGGMKQRLALARALAVEPAVLLMDEPFGALDAITRDLLHRELQELWMKTGKTVVFVTHNVREAVVLGDRVLVMSPRPGRLVAEHCVDLPRPRQIEDVGTVNLARRILADLHLKEEAHVLRASR
ncbi:MAG: ABC transporter ATP-binding protein [Chloroflexi bacterium]|nr:ABC transporter ATP-binding protein [Chloroflexota bacterium]